MMNYSYALNDKKFMKSSLFWRGERVGRPRSFLLSGCTFISNMAGPWVSWSHWTPFIHHIIYSHCYPALQGVTFQIRLILNKEQKYYGTDCLYCLLTCICKFISHTRLLELWRRHQLCLGDNVDYKASSEKFIHPFTCTYKICNS